MRITSIGRLVLMLVVTHGLAQKPLAIIDSLQTELSKTPDDTARSLVMAELAFRYYTIPDSMRTIALRGLALAKSIHNDKAIAANMASLVAYYGNIGDNITGLKLASETIRLIRKVGDERLLGQIYLHIAVMYTETGDQARALEGFKKALSVLIKSEDPHMISIGYNNVGYSYLLQESYDSSEFYLTQAFRIAKHNAPQNLYLILGSLAELSEKTGHYKKAFDFLRESMRLNGDADIRISSDNYLQLAKLSVHLNNMADAFRYGQESLSLAEKGNFYFMAKPAAALLSDLYEKNHQPEKANWYLKKNLAATDSMYAASRKKEFNDLKRKFDNEAREARITILEHENALRKINLAGQEEKISRQRIMLTVAIFLVALLGVLLFSLRSQEAARKKYVRIIEGNRNEIQKKAVELSDLNEQLMTLNETLEMKANEKAQQLIMHEEKLRKYAFLNSHHLRGPVATILGIANLIESGYVEKSEQNELLEKAICEIKKIDGVVREITQAID